MKAWRCYCSNYSESHKRHSYCMKDKEMYVTDYKHLYCETENGSLNQLSFIRLYQYYWNNHSNSKAIQVHIY